MAKKEYLPVPTVFGTLFDGDMAKRIRERCDEMGIDPKYYLHELVRCDLEHRLIERKDKRRAS